MFLKYLPILAKKSAPKPPRELRPITKPAWHPLSRPLSEARVALITSGAIRERSQTPFPPLGDASYRPISPDPAFTDLQIDHRTRFGVPARQDPEVAFPRLALQTLAEQGQIGGVAEYHYSIYGGIRDYDGIEDCLAPVLAKQLAEGGADLAVFLPF